MVLVCVLVLYGCSRTRVIDRISIIHAFGIDLADNGELIGTALVPDYSMGEAGDQIQMLEEQVPNGVLFVPELGTHTSTRVELAKIRVVVFGKDYAESGVRDMVERFILTPEIGTNIQLAISTDTARETLSQFKQEKSLTLADRLEHNMVGGHLPNMKLHYFLNDFFGEGMDAYIPMISLDDNGRVKIEGIGIFKEDKLKLQLTPEQTSIFSFIKDKNSLATSLIRLDEEDRRENITVRGFRSKRDWNWDQQKNELSLHLQLQMTLTQYPNRFHLEKEEDLKKIEKLVVEHLEQEMKDLLATFQENEVDPLGIGNIVRSQDRTWEEESFYEEYPTLPIKVNVDFQLIHSGLEGKYIRMDCYEHRGKSK